MKIAVLVLLSVAAYSQQAIPPGTILAVRLNSSLNTRKSKPGQPITARVMQDVPLSGKGKIPAGSKIEGTVISASPLSPGSPAQITFRFDRLKASHHSFLINTSLRAFASLMDVHDAQVPPTGTDRGTPWAWMTRRLIGGEVVYGDGGPVAHGNETVGRGLADGVLVAPQANARGGCRGEMYGNHQPQALWVFSSDACGLYDIDDASLSHAGRSEPFGQISLVSPKSNLNVEAGSGLLLRVNAEQY